MKAQLSVMKAQVNVVKAQVSVMPLIHVKHYFKIFLLIKVVQNTSQWQL